MESNSCLGLSLRNRLSHSFCRVAMERRRLGFRQAALREGSEEGTGRATTSFVEAPSVLVAGFESRKGADLIHLAQVP